MNNNDKYKNELDNIKPSDELIKETINKISEKQTKRGSIFSFQKLAVGVCSLALIAGGTYTYFNVISDDANISESSENLKYSPNLVKQVNDETILSVEKTINKTVQSFEKISYKKSIESLGLVEINKNNFKGMYLISEYGASAKWVKANHTREYANYEKFYNYLKELTKGTTFIGYTPRANEGIQGDCVYINVYKKPSGVTKGTYAVDINDQYTLYVPKNNSQRMYFVNRGLEKLEVVEIKISNKDEELFSEFRKFIETTGIRVPDEKLENPDMNNDLIINGEEVKEDVVIYKNKVDNKYNTTKLNMYNELVVEFKNNYGHVKSPKVEFNKEYVLSENVNTYISLTKSDAIANTIVYLLKNGDVYSVDTVKWVSSGKANPVKLASGVSEISNDNQDNLYVTIKGKKKLIDYDYTGKKEDINSNSTQDKEEVDTNIRETVEETKQSTTYSSIHHKPHMDLVITFKEKYKNMENNVELNKEYLIATDVKYYEYILGQSIYSKIYYVTTDGNLYYVNSVDIVKTGEVKPQLLATNIVRLGADNNDRVTAYDKNNKVYRYMNSKDKEEQ